MSPIGNGDGKEDSIGLEVVKDTVQLMATPGLGGKAAGKSKKQRPAVFKVVSGGKQCVKFQLTGAGKKYYEFEREQGGKFSQIYCFSPVGELKVRSLKVTR